MKKRRQMHACVHEYLNAAFSRHGGITVGLLCKKEL